MFNIFGLLATPLGYAMQFLYFIVSNYGWAIIIFTLLVRLILFPLSLKQQRSTARMQAFQPMIKEVQKKWANDRNRQNAEMQKLYQENNIKMSAGCLPMLVNMLVLFGMIAVIQAPMNHILKVQETEINVGYAIIQHYNPDSGIEKSNAGYTRQSVLIDTIKNEETRQWFEDGASIPIYNGAAFVIPEGQTVEMYDSEDNKVTNASEAEYGLLFDKDGKQVMNGEEAVKLTYTHTSMDQKVIDDIVGFNFEFLGLNMAEPPTFSMEKWYTLVFPVLSLLTMVLSQVIIMKTSGAQQGRMQMLIMTLLFGVLFAFYAFTVPAGFSLYYTISNIVMTIQQLIVRKIHDPEKIKEQVMAEIEARKAAKKAKKKLVVKEAASGEEREVSEAEFVKIRLEKARELDAKKYADDVQDKNENTLSEADSEA